jgi:xylulose-5-phosphate/fructose-6-phosphate phosphoketolase
MVANTYLEGSYSEVYPEVGQDEEGMRRLFRQFSFPGGIPSHAAPETPGSINEGGELGYALAHAYGAVLDNPTLLAACVIGDGEAETGALAASWHSNKFLDPAGDGAVLPILHLNGWKIANPTVLARIPESELPATTRPTCTASWPTRSTPRSTTSPRPSRRPAPAPGAAPAGR